MILGSNVNHRQWVNRSDFIDNQSTTVLLKGKQKQFTMMSQRPEWSEEQRVYAASGGEEQRVCVERVWGANLQRIVPFI